jgi:hypothetical protein
MILQLIHNPRYQITKIIPPNLQTATKAITEMKPASSKKTILLTQKPMSHPSDEQDAPPRTAKEPPRPKPISSLTFPSVARY